MNYFETDDDIAEMSAQIFYAKRRYSALIAYPSCQDPDHPGCESCEGDDNDD